MVDQTDATPSSFSLGRKFQRLKFSGLTFFQPEFENELPTDPLSGGGVYSQLPALEGHVNKEKVGIVDLPSPCITRDPRFSLKTVHWILGLLPLLRCTIHNYTFHCKKLTISYLLWYGYWDKHCTGWGDSRRSDYPFVHPSWNWTPDLQY
jgi:hypothetical protein